MNIILAINEKRIEKYISSLKDCNVIKVKKDNKNLIDEVIQLNPHLLIMSNALIQKMSNTEVIETLRKKQPQTRIVYLYGKDDEYRKSFTNFLITNGVYDFCVGAIDDEVLIELIREPKSISDVSLEDLTKDEMLKMKKAEEERNEKLRKAEEEAKQELEEDLINGEIDQEEFNNLVEEKIEEKVLIKEVKKLEVRIIERVEEIEKEKIIEKKVYKTKIIDQKTLTFLSLTSSTLKDFMISNVASLISEQSKVLVIDFDSPFPSIDHHFGIKKEIYLEDYYSDKRLTGVLGCISAIKRNVFNKNTFKNFVTKTKNKNVDVLTGLFDIETFDSIEQDEIVEIINKAKQNYEVVLIAANNFIANGFTYYSIENSDRVIIVSEDTYANARMNISFIDEMTENQSEDINKFNITLFGEIYNAIPTINKLYEGYSLLPFIQTTLKPYYESLNNKKICVNLDTKERMKFNNLIQSLGFGEIQDKGFKAFVSKFKEAIR